MADERCSPNLMRQRLVKIVEQRRVFHFKDLGVQAWVTIANVVDTVIYIVFLYQQCIGLIARSVYLKCLLFMRTHGTYS